MRSLFHLALLLFISYSLCVCVAQQVPNVILNKAVQYAQQQRPNESMEKIDYTRLYKIAKEWLATGNKSDSHALLLYLAEQGHVPSIATMGLELLEAGNRELALSYFQKAGEEGHHASLYNAGRLFAEHQDYVKALNYFQVAARLHKTNPKYAEEGMTKVANEAYEITSKHLSRIDLDPSRVGDAFLFGSLEDLPEKVERQWRSVIEALFKEGRDIDRESLLESADMLQTLLEKTDISTLSPLQQYLMLNLMVDLGSILMETNESYFGTTALYAEMLASTPLCREQYSDSKDDPGCFNKALTTALSIYRRLGDEKNAERILNLGEVASGS